MIDFSLERELYKPFYGAATSGKTELSLRCARNSFSAFQIIVSGEEFILNVGTQPCFGQVLSLGTVRLCAECELGTELFIEQFHTDDDGAKKADALLKSKTCETSYGAVYARINVPADAKSGIYKGKIKAYSCRMFEKETLIKELEYTVNVAEYVMPDPSDFSLHLDLWQHLTGIARVHEVALWSDEHFEIIEKYATALGALGQKCVTLVVSEVPWNGQLCCKQTAKANLYEYSIIPVVKEDDGFHYDYSLMQRYIDICAKCGITREITLIGLLGVWASAENGFGAPAADYPDAVRIRYLDKRTGIYAYMDNGADIDAYISSLESYFARKGLTDKVRVCADEPADVEAFAVCAAHLHTLAPSLKMKSAINHSEFIRRFNDVISDFVPFIQCVSREYEALCEFRDSMPDSRFMWYVCCGPMHPNNFLRNPLRQTLMFGILTSYFGFDGFLRWSYTVFNDDPRGDIRYPAFPAGDLYLVYPSRGGDVLLSLRYMAMRRSMEIFELFTQLKESGADLTELYDTVIKERDIKRLASCELAENEYMSCVDDDYYTLYAKLLDMLENKPKGTEQ